MTMPAQTKARRDDRELVLGHPAPTLADQVLGYRGFRIGARSLRRRLVMPDGVVKVMVGFGEPLRVVDATGARGTVSGTALVNGMGTTATIGEHTGMLDGITVLLPPPAAYRIFGMPMSEVAHGVFDLVDVLGPAMRRLPDRLADGPDWATRFAVLDRFLAARLDSGPHCAPEVDRAWRLLRAGSGRIGIAALATETGWSIRQLQRRFREQIGLSPKALAGVLRMQHALRLADTGIPWAQVAVEAGFYDQPHFVRVFTAMTGSTPCRFRAVRDRVPDWDPQDFLPGLVTGALLKR